MHVHDNHIIRTLIPILLFVSHNHRTSAALSLKKSPAVSPAPMKQESETSVEDQERKARRSILRKAGYRHFNVNCKKRYEFRI